MGRYCSYLLPKQTRGTTQILIFESLQMIGRPILYSKISQKDEVHCHATSAFIQRIENTQLGNRLEQ